MPGISGKVVLEACQDEAGNAANVPMLQELQLGAPRREQVRKLSTNAGDRRTLEKHLLLIAQGAGVTLHAEALRRGTSLWRRATVRSRWQPSQNLMTLNPEQLMCILV
jgi:hypothetical protein